MDTSDTFPVKQETIRDEQGRFINGVSGNPKGRPKKGMTLTDIAKEILEEELPNGITRKEALMKKVAQLAYEGNETMIKLLWNYVDGMPKQKIEGDLNIKGFMKGYIDETDKSGDEEISSEAD